MTDALDRVTARISTMQNELIEASIELSDMRANPKLDEGAICRRLSRIAYLASRSRSELRGADPSSWDEPSEPSEQQRRPDLSPKEQSPASS